MKIVALKSTNIKKLKAVEIVPDPEKGLVTITGKNDNGKTSVLDSILIGLCGAKYTPDMPIRAGESKATVEIDLGDCVVTRRISASGNSVTVRNKEGFSRPSPQKFLDEIVGRISFDPMKFVNENSAKQKAILMDLVGLNVAEFDTNIKKLTDERLYVGRDGKQMEERLRNMPYHEDAPAEMVSASGLMDKMNEALAHNEKIAGLNRQIKESQDKTDLFIREQQDFHARLKDLEQLQRVEEQRAVDLMSEVSKLKPIDAEEVRVQLQSQDELNHQVRDNNAYRNVHGELKIFRQKYGEKTAELEKIKGERQKQLENAKFPVQGLSFNEDGVTFNGIPLNQISASEKIKVGLGVSMALNPTLRVLRIIDGSLLDSENMALIESLVKQQDFQVWIEKVDDSSPAAIEIVDGEVGHDES